MVELIAQTAAQANIDAHPPRCRFHSDLSAPNHPSESQPHQRGAPPNDLAIIHNGCGAAASILQRIFEFTTITISPLSQAPYHTSRISRPNACTFCDASPAAAAATAASNHKTAQNDRMAFLTTSSGCFRDSLVSYFTGPKRVARRSFSTWLLELVFADREVLQQRVICCDACQQRLIHPAGATRLRQESAGPLTGL
jgi:hypothetical protein